MWACKSGNLTQVQKSLEELKNEGELNFHNIQIQGHNCLHLAAREGHLEVMKFLQINLDSRVFTLALDAHAKITNNRITVLEIASIYGE